MANVPEDLQERIAAYIDGELSPAEAARLEVFLANTDPQLADQVVGMLADKTRLRNTTRPMAPRDLSARIMEQIERSSLLRDVEHDTVHRHRWWHSKMAVAAGVALVLGGFGYFIASSVLSPTNTHWRESVQPKEQQVATGVPMAGTPAPSSPAAPVPEAAPVAAPVASAGPMKATMDKEGDAPRMVADAGKQESAGALQKGIGSRETGGVRSAAMASKRDEDKAMPAARGAVAPGSAEKPQQALALMAGIAGEEPIVLTFVPKDAEEMGRLTSAIDQLVVANQKEFGAAQNAVRDDRATASNGFNNWSNNADSRSGARGGFGGGGKAAEGVSNTAQPLYSNQTSTNQAATFDQKANVAAMLLRVQLKPEQVEKLADEYRVGLVARGGKAYQFQERAPVTADQGQRQMMLRRAGYADGQAETASAVSQPATMAAAREGLNEYVITIEPPAGVAVPAETVGAGNTPATTLPAGK